MDTGPTYLERGFERIPALLTEEQAREQLEATSYLPVRRVHSASGEDDFGSQDIPWVHPLHYFFVGPALERGRLCAAEERPLVRAICWTSIYSAGERIAPHRDVSGDMQLLVVLRRPPKDCGGALFITDRKNESHRLQLEVGDGFVFHASGLLHSTEPLIATATCPNPQRVVAVGRYFFGE